MAHNATGRIFVDHTDPTNPVGITLEEIKAVLNAQAGQELSNHTNINQFSAVKPVRSSDLVVTDFAELNYGVDCDPESDTSVVDDISRAISNASTDDDWSDSYLKPRGLSSGDLARVMDFDGYEHQAPSPVSATKPSGSVASDTASVQVSLDGDARSIQIHLMDAIENWAIEGWDEGKENLRYVLVVAGFGMQYIIGDAVFTYNSQTHEYEFNDSCSFQITGIQEERRYSACVVIAPCLSENGHLILAGDSSDYPSKSAGDTPAMHLPSTYCSFSRPGPHTGIEIVDFEVWGESDGNSGLIDRICWRYTFVNNTGWSITFPSSNLLEADAEQEWDDEYDFHGHLIHEGYVVKEEISHSGWQDSAEGQTISNGSSLTVTGEFDFGGGESGMVLIDLVLRYIHSGYGQSPQQIRLCGDYSDWDQYDADPGAKSEQVFLDNEHDEEDDD